jgi:hypothetical protein
MKVIRRAARRPEHAVRRGAYVKFCLLATQVDSWSASIDGSMMPAPILQSRALAPFSLGGFS